MIESNPKDVSAGVMRRIRWHNVTPKLMGLAAFLFIMGMVMSRGGSRGGPGVAISHLGPVIFVIALLYGGASTIFNLRCPNCKTMFGSVVSTLYAPFGVRDEFSPKCVGCGAVLLPPGARARAMRGVRIAIVVMVTLPVVAALLGWLLGGR